MDVLNVTGKLCDTSENFSDRRNVQFKLVMTGKDISIDILNAQGEEIASATLEVHDKMVLIHAWDFENWGNDPIVSRILVPDIFNMPVIPEEEM